MFLILLLAIIAIILMVMVAAIGVSGGVIFVLLFGDVIVCVWLIVAIIRKLIKRKRNK